MKSVVKLVNQRNLKVKVCGMRDVANVQQIKQLPIHFMGFIFYEPSLRFVELNGVPDFNFGLLSQWGIKRVGVFVNADLEYVIAKYAQYQLDYVQLHGEESIFYCKHLHDLGIRIIKAFAVDDDFDFNATRGYELFCDYLLFDTKGLLPGGNGVPFNWEVLKKYKGETPFLLGGGVGEGLEEKIVALDHPQYAGIDLNSKFEIKPGLKNDQQIQTFLDKIFDQQL